MDFAFIGGGNMGRAMAQALVERNVCPPQRVLVVEPDAAARERLAPLNFQLSALPDARVGEAAVVVFAAAAMLSNMAAELDKRGLPLGFGFLEQPASFAIAEGLLDYTESDSYWRAFSVGVVNTIQVSLLGIVLATLLGTVIGVVKSFQIMDGHLNSNAVGAGLGIACMTTIFGLGIAVVASVSSYVFDWMVAEPVAEEVGS